MEPETTCYYDNLVALLLCLSTSLWLELTIWGRVLDHIFKVKEVLPDRITVDHVWRSSDESGVLLYKMVLSSRQKMLFE